MAEESIFGNFPRLPKRSLIYVLVCAGGILCFIAGGILPSQRAMSNLDEEAAKIRSQLHQQEILFPVFRKALQTLHENKENDLPVPEKSSIAKKDINSISSYFRNLASECGLHFESGIPDVGKINNTSGVIPFKLVLKGDYFDFRIFLTKLVLVPYLEHIETVQIYSGSGMKEYRLRIKLSTHTGAVKK